MNAFFQDEWHVSRRFTLTLGLRYEYSQPKLDTQGRSFSIIPGQQSTVFSDAPVGMVFPGDKGAPVGTNFPDKNNWGPRFGFAWDPKGDGKTSIRGGFGMFYDVLKGEDNLQFNGQPPFFCCRIAYSAYLYPPLDRWVTFLISATLMGQQAFQIRFPRNRQPPISISRRPAFCRLITLSLCTS